MGGFVSKQLVWNLAARIVPSNTLFGISPSPSHFQKGIGSVGYGRACLQTVCLELTCTHRAFKYPVWKQTIPISASNRD